MEPRLARLSFFAASTFFALLCCRSLAGLPDVGETEETSLPPHEDVLVVDVPDSEDEVRETPACGSTHHRSHTPPLVLVSTLDGKVSALDMYNGGQLKWTLDTDEAEPLLSASISRLELTRNGRPMQLIPSLDGGLFQWDGESLEAVPFTADTLVSSTYKMNDDSMLVGGKETKTYGVHAKTGKLQYICTSGGCTNFGSNETETAQTDHEEDIIIVKRLQQTVRSVEHRKGMEQWNFSVGQHELVFLEGNHDNSMNDSSDDVPDDVIEDVPCKSSNMYSSWDYYEEESLTSIKVSVPDGVVSAVRQDRPDKVIWKYKFPSPVAAAWTLEEGELLPVGLFDQTHVPALTSEDQTLPPDDVTQPAMYLGVHNGQMYVQLSSKMAAEVDMVAKAKLLMDKKLPMAIPKTPILLTGGQSPPLLTYEPELDRPPIDHPTGNVDYPYDSGYYLFSDDPNCCPLEEGKDRHRRSVEQNSSSQKLVVQDDFTARLLSWWQEVVAISVVTSGIVLLIQNFRKKDVKTDSQGSTSSGSQTLTDTSADQTKPGLDAGEYKSRYLTDFDLVQCLGRGGFGVVYEVKNKFDECSYAIKRISLPNRKDARDKVLREAKALAKLDHPGIVRYFGTWEETPPPGWQEAKDRELLGELSGTMASLPSSPNASSAEVIRPVRRAAQLHFSRETSVEETPLDRTKPLYHRQLSDSFTQKLADLSGTGGFVPKLAQYDREHTEISESSSIVFEDVSANNDDGSLPFQSYQRSITRGESSGIGTSTSVVAKDDSFQILFEESSSSNQTNPEELDGNVSDSSSLYDVVHTQNQCPDVDHQSETDSNAKSKCHDDNLKEAERPSKTDTDLQKKAKAPSPKVYLYIQMQLCQKETLKDWLVLHTPDRDRSDSLHIFHQIATAVEYVHNRGLMHRDLKPSNIFFSLDGVVKIGDFGLVTAMDEGVHGEDVVPDVAVGRADRRHTDQVGTQLYMSSEQIAGKAYTHKVDIFSLGLIFFELLHPFSTQMERVRILLDVKKQRLPLPFVEKNRAEANFVRWLVSHDPSLRPSATEIMNSPLLKNRKLPTPQPKKQSRIRKLSSSSN
ncbi:PREDICTED: eukaryotic translation initiation factor 2-alpha kinase 3-like [Branchiostoma belcheri]|uniref:non-specific serine/threonine protein kinase n=1 Tax=Branchiostoma belcheri TaxID=7741 RepID=A0A6P4Z9Z3_BRABE|nr:PREDICTED: eukaryotic translation initiation factor 2-alpha kinase 3-like [Branchiostoma belcheri]